MKKKIIFIVGPTAAGKTEDALSLAKKINGEIISCDSMQVYKGMGVLTSQPSLKFKKQIPHHLIDIVPPTREYNVASYHKAALRKINEIIKRGKVPVFAGGTGLYMSIAVNGIFKIKPPSELIRKRLYRQAEIQGSRYLHDKLKKIDPQAALKIHPNDTKRLVRALEVFMATGKPISYLQKQRKGLSENYDVEIFCLDLPQELLYSRIEKRVDRMFKQGLLGEVEKLLKLKLSKTAQYAIGINELKGYFKGEYDLDTAKALMKRNTKAYAKRQLTWFRKDKRIKWLQIKENQKPRNIGDRIWKELF